MSTQSATKTLLQLMTVSCFALLSNTAAAQARPDYGPGINLEGAKKIATGVLAECRANKWNVAVAVVDNSGGLIYFERMDNTQTASMNIAILKARNGAMYRRPTRAFADAIAKTGPATMTLPEVTASPGGLPIMADGKVIGGVGVSGVTGDQDEQCAMAGLK